MKRNKLAQFFILSFITVLFSCQAGKDRHEQTHLSYESARNEVLNVLDQQASCWSKGDLECYMEGYWKSDSLVFVGKSGLTHGWQPTLDNYKRNYPDLAAMGKLTFDILEINPISDDTMLVIGKWHLAREVEAGNLSGHFSVIFKQFPTGWKIIADHSS
jgi:ketosteroid isomerase-like protein